MTDYLDNVRKWVNDAIVELENRAEALQTEQDDSESAYAEWEKHEGDPAEAEDAPDVEDHSAEIEKLNRASGLLESALDELATQ